MANNRALKFCQPSPYKSQLSHLMESFNFFFKVSNVNLLVTQAKMPYVSRTKPHTIGVQFTAPNDYSVRYTKAAQPQSLNWGKKLGNSQLSSCLRSLKGEAEVLYLQLIGGKQVVHPQRKMVVWLHL